jgi:spore coat protein CotF
MVMYFTKADNEISENMYYEQTLLRIKQVSTGIATTTTTTTTKALQRRTPYQ